MGLLIDFIVYGYTVTLGVISVTAAIFKPPLGVLGCVGLAAFFLDSNKRVFGRFFVSPSCFVGKNAFVTGYHQAYFFSFIAALFVNLFFWLFPEFRIQIEEIWWTN